MVVSRVVGRVGAGVVGVVAAGVAAVVVAAVVFAGGAGVDPSSPVSLVRLALASSSDDHDGHNFFPHEK